MIYLLHCVISFTMYNADGIEETRVYDPAIGITTSMNTQYLNIDFSRWQKKNKIDMPWTTLDIDVNRCNVVRAYSSESAIPEDQF